MLNPAALLRRNGAPHRWRMAAGGWRRRRLRIHQTTSYPRHRGAVFAFSSDNYNANDNEKTKSIHPNTSPPPAPRSTLTATKLMDESWTGIGQVLFLNSATAGKILLASLALGSISGDAPLAAAACAALGAATSTVTAHVAQLDESTAARGLYSYNGCLVGCAASAFGAASATPAAAAAGTLCWGIPAAAACTVVGAAASTFVTAALTKVTGSMPQWTYAFNIVALTALLRTQPLLVASGGASAGVVDTAAAAIAATTATPAISSLQLLLSPLTGLSQIFVVESALTGAGIIAAIAGYSPALAAHAVAGSLTGTLVGGLLLAAPPAELAAGLYGYNSALTSLSVAVFFVPSARSRVLSVTGAAATAAVFGALQPVLGGPPCLTLPFCLTMSACWMLGSPIASAAAPLVPGLLLAPNPHSPERNSIAA